MTDDQFHAFIETPLAHKLGYAALRLIPLVELRPTSPTRFFIADTDMDVSFHERDGRIVALELAGLNAPRLD